MNPHTFARTMRITTFHLALVLVALLHAAASQAFTITITTNGYRGNISVDKGPLQYITDEEWKLDLAAGDHYFETGAGIGSSIIRFTVGTDGSVSALSPQASASPGIIKGSIVLNTVSLQVLPGKYQGDYILSAYKVQDKVRLFRGKQKLVLIAGLVYYLDDMAAVSSRWCLEGKCNGVPSFNSALYFTIAPSGEVKVDNNVAAYGGAGGRLHLNSVAVRITQDMIPAGGFLLWCGDKRNKIQAPKVIRMIPGLVAWIQRSDKNKPDYFVERMCNALKPLVPLP